jgi:hypothetical protein
VRAVEPGEPANVLVAGARLEGVTLYLAANGCDVITVEEAPDVVARVLSAAEEAGLTARVRGCVTDIGHWTPDVPLNAFVCTPAAFDGLSAVERRRVIELLKSATADGGVHLVETILAGQEAELRDRYVGWEITVERDPAALSRAFVARKSVA